MAQIQSAQMTAVTTITQSTRHRPRRRGSRRGLAYGSARSTDGVVDDGGGGVACWFVGDMACPGAMTRASHIHHFKSMFLNTLSCASVSSICVRSIASTEPPAASFSASSVIRSNRVAWPPKRWMP